MLHAYKSDCDLKSSETEFEVSQHESHGEERWTGSASSHKGKRPTGESERPQYPVFYGKEGEDPEKYLRNFVRACVCNGDKTPAEWLDLLPIFLEDRAWQWHQRLTPEMQKNSDLLTRELKYEFNLNRSCQSLIGSLMTMKQRPEESMQEYWERFSELRSRVDRSLKRSSAPAADECIKTYFFIAGLQPRLHEFVKYKDPNTFNEAAALAIIEEHCAA